MPDTSQGKATPISSGVIARIGHAARNLISGVTTSTWFGPFEPLAPMAPPDVAGRRFDYDVGVNLNYNPRSTEPVTFAQLRELADSCDILRSVIETRKDQLEGLGWNMRVKIDPNDKKAKATDDQKRRIDEITAFLQMPDKVNSFSNWQRQILEDMFVLDAVAIYKRPTRGGKLWGLEIIDGSTIKPLVDDSGRMPMAPGDPAYQQVLKGIPAVNYTREELAYIIRNPRSHKIYGYSHVEQIIITVNIQLRRALGQLEYYREGSQPDAFIGLPKEWMPEQIIAYQKNFDAMLAGNIGQRRRLKMMPGDFSYQATKEPPLKDDFDEWLARVICYVLSVPPTPFIKQMNRSTADNAQESSQSEGLGPLKRYMCGILNPIIATNFGSPDLEFSYTDDAAQDAKKQADILVAYTNNGILTIDEAREKIGDEPVGGAASINMVKTAKGYVTLESALAEPQDGEKDDETAADDNEDESGKSAPATKLVKKKPPLYGRSTNGLNPKR